MADFDRIDHRQEAIKAAASATIRIARSRRVECGNIRFTHLLAAT